MLPSVDQAWFARYVHRYDDRPHRGCARARGGGDSVGTAPAAAPYGSAVRGTRERLIHTGTSEKDTGPRTGSKAAAGFFMVADGRGGFRGGIAMKLYSQKDVDRKALKGARIAVLGYGSQGRAHALNLKDSGFDVVVGVRKKGASWKKAKKDGLEVAEPADAAEGADLVAMLVPDLAQKALYDEVEKSLGKGATLLFAHGFNIHYKQIKPRKDLDVVLIAPKGPGGLVRRQYQQGRGVPCLLAVAQDSTGNAFAKALAYGHGIGGTRGGVLETTFAEETETDLFGEQAVLCG